MSTLHTPGPWRLVPWMDGHSRGRILGPDGETLAHIEDVREQGPHNQALMGAAPEMFAALQDLAHPEQRTDCNERSCGECSTCRARAAIARATPSPEGARP